jgi:class 3 adenylate cyclase/tetratricopeptide (TPR) repeat protein
VAVFDPNTIPWVELRDGTWTIVFTDLVGSTEQRARLGDRAADALRREHDAIVRRSTLRFRGQVVKSTGDGSMLAFPGAGDGVAATMAIQQGLARRNREGHEPIQVRIGCSVGDVRAEEGDLFGMPVVTAARLCSIAAADQIVCSDLVRLIAGSGVADALVPLGTVELKGFAEPLAVWEVAWAPSDDEERVPFPSLLSPQAALPFAGRDAAVQQSVGAWRRSVASEAPVALLVSGEPGIGKTRLSSEVARRAYADGALVLYGRCSEQLGVPFEPFAEALGWFVEHTPELLEEQLGRFAPDLSRVAPRVRDRLPRLPDPLEGETETVRRRVFDALAEWLRTVATERPTVLVLDDLQWAGPGTLDVLRHLMRSIQGVPLLLAGTYRDTDVDEGHPLTGVLADFRRLPNVEWVLLDGLDDDDLKGLLGHDGATADAAEFARALRAETDGNPFFVGEVLQSLAETGVLERDDDGWRLRGSVDSIGIPDGVRAVVRQRVQRLGSDANAVLEVAALFGQECRGDVIAAVAQRELTDVVATMEAATRAGLVEETGLDRYRFAHALVRSTLTDAQSASRRARIHAAIGAELERVAPADVSALAFHFCAAATAGDPRRAVRYSREAGSQARDRAAYEDAIAVYERALELVGQAGLGDERRVLLVDLAEAQVIVGDPRYGDTLDIALSEAGAAGDAAAFVRAVLLRSTGYSFEAASKITIEAQAIESDDAVVTLLEDALVTVGTEPTAERARLLSVMAGQLLFESFDRRLALATEALDIAERLDDPELFVQVAASWLVVAWAPHMLEPRLELTERMAALGPTLRNPVWRWHAYAVQAPWEAGRLDIVDRHIAAIDRTDAVAFAFGRWQNHLGLAKRELFAGRIERAESHAEEASGIARESGFASGDLLYAAQLCAIRLEQGRADEMIPFVRAVVPTLSGWYEAVSMSVFALLLATDGQLEEAAELLAREKENGFTSLGRDPGALLYLSDWADVAASVGDTGAAQILFAHLDPWSDRVVNFVAVAQGMVGRAVGRLECTLGRYDEAELRLDRMARRLDELGAPLWRARTLADLAATLSARGKAADGPRTRGLVDHAVALAQEHSAAGVERYARGVLLGSDTAR